MLGMAGKGQWISLSRSENSAASSVFTSHAELFDQAEFTISVAFSNLQRSLFDLQNQLLTKVRTIHASQQIIMAECPDYCCPEYAENCKKIHRLLNQFSTHAENLAHVKLTLARAAALVSPDGDLVKLVTRPHTPPMQRMPQILPRPRMITTEFLDSSIDSLPWNDPSSVSVIRGLPSSPSGDFLSSASLRTEVARPNCTCFVFYLPPTMTNQSLRELFSECGVVLNAYVAMDKLTNRTRGFGFVDFATPADAEKAIAKMDKYAIDGKFLSVTLKV
jgi:hypothetical protein